MTSIWGTRWAFFQETRKSINSIHYTMKKMLILFFLTLYFASLSYSQKINENKIPDTVKSSFYGKFPSAENVKWGKENKSVYEAEFKLNDTDMSANFSEVGEWLETETEIQVTSLPQSVTDAVNRDYKDAKITGASKIERPDNKIIYEADIKYNHHKKEVLYDEQGNGVK